MKIQKTLAILMAAISVSFAFSSCEKAIIDGAEDDATEETTDDTIEQGKGELYVSCSFSQTMAELTRASSTPLYECAERVQFIILKDNDIVYNSEQINGGGNSFGTLSVNLDPGTYRLIVFAHNDNSNSITVSHEDGSGDVCITGYGGRATDSFSYSDEVVIQKDKRKSVSCKLTRCVGFITFVSTDEIPTDVTKLKVTYTGVSAQYDAVNQIGTGDNVYATNVVNISSAWKSDTGTLKNVRSYVFLPASEATVTAKMEFYDADGNVLYTRTMEGIDMKVNAQTTVTAAMFQADGMNAQVSVDTDWGTAISQDL